MEFEIFVRKRRRSLSFPFEMHKGFHYDELIWILQICDTPRQSKKEGNGRLDRMFMTSAFNFDSLRSIYSGAFP